MGMFDEVPLSEDKEYLRDELSRVDKCWSAARFDSLPHVVRILTSRDQNSELRYLKEQIDIVEDVVNEVVHTYHGGFNRAIQNYSQILRLFSESSESIGGLKVNLAEGKKRLSVRNKQLHQLWYRSVTLRHIISLLDQIEGISKVPARIEKLISDKQFYAAIQLHIHSALMLEREGLQSVGALQDIRSELTKLHGILFNKVLEDLHAHLYNKGEYSPVASSMHEKDDEVQSTTAVSITANTSQPLSQRTSQFGGQGLVDGSYRPSSIEGGLSYDGHVEDGSLEPNDGRNGGDGKDARVLTHQIPLWLLNSTPDEFIESIEKSDAPIHVKYLKTMVECLCLLHKVPAAGSSICQRLRPTVHEIITSRIKAHSDFTNSSSSGNDKGTQTGTTSLHFLEGQLESYQLSKQKRQNGISLAGSLLAVSPVSPVMAPTGKAQIAAKELLGSILDSVVRIFGNHVIVGELIESKFSPQSDMKTQKSNSKDANLDYSIGFSLTVLQSECQQLICEILRATPEAASADAAAQTARLASKIPTKDKSDGSEDGLSFAFRFADATLSVANQGWSKKGPNVSQEGYGSAAVLPEQGIYLAASLYRPVLQFQDKVSSMLPKKYSQLRNDGLLAFVENFVKDHLLPTMFVDYRKSVQQALSSPAAFRPRAHSGVSYSSSIEKNRPVLQGLLAIDFLAKEVLGWAQAMPKFAADLMNYAQTFLERTYERCRTSYTEAVLEKQSYMIIGRHDIDKLMRRDPASVCLPISSDDKSNEVESEICDLLLNLRPIRQENLIRDNNKIVLLASLSDSLEYAADSIKRLVEASPKISNHVESGKPSQKGSSHAKDLPSFADEYRKLATDCLKVLRVEMQLETIFHLQEMTHREYRENQDAEEPDDFVISLAAQITRRDEEIVPFVSVAKRNYIFGGVCSIAASTCIKALVDMKSINLFGAQQICQNSIALEQAIAAIPSVDSEAVQQKLEHVRSYYELLNMPFESLLAFITENGHVFTTAEYFNLLKVQIPGREIPPDAQNQIKEALSR